MNITIKGITMLDEEMYSALHEHILGTKLFNYKCVGVSVISLEEFHHYRMLVMEIIEDPMFELEQCEIDTKCDEILTLIIRRFLTTRTLNNSDRLISDIGETLGALEWDKENFFNQYNKHLMVIHNAVRSFLHKHKLNHHEYDLELIADGRTAGFMITDEVYINTSREQSKLYAVFKFYT